MLMKGFREPNKTESLQILPISNLIQAASAQEKRDVWFPVSLLQLPPQKKTSTETVCFSGGPALIFQRFQWIIVSKNISLHPHTSNFLYC